MAAAKRRCSVAPFGIATPRIAVWRKLRQLGVAQVLDGLVALPADARSRERLEWVSACVLEAGGEASVWLGRLASARQERDLAAAMASAVAAEYRAVEAEAQESRDAVVGSRRRTLARLRRELRRIGEQRHRVPHPDPQHVPRLRRQNRHRPGNGEFLKSSLQAEVRPQV